MCMTVCGRHVRTSSWQTRLRLLRHCTAGRQVDDTRHPLLKQQGQPSHQDNYDIASAQRLVICTVVCGGYRTVGISTVPSQADRSVEAGPLVFCCRGFIHV